MKRTWFVKRGLIVIAALALLVLVGVFFTAGADDRGYQDNTPGNASDSRYDITGLSVNSTSVTSGQIGSMYYIDGDNIVFTLALKEGISSGTVKVDQAYVETNAFDPKKTAAQITATDNGGATITITNANPTHVADGGIEGTVVYEITDGADVFYQRSGFYIPISNTKLPLRLTVNQEAFAAREYDGTKEVDVDKANASLALIHNQSFGNDEVRLDAASIPSAEYALKSKDVSSSRTIVISDVNLTGAQADRYRIDGEIDNVGKSLRWAKELTLTMFENNKPASRVYNGSTRITGTYAIHASGLCDGDTHEEYPVAASSARFTNADFEEQKSILVSGVRLASNPGDNYTIDDEIVIENLGKLILPRPIGVMIEDHVKTYGTEETSYNHSVTKIVGLESGLLDGDDAELVFSRKGAGVYTSGGHESVDTYDDEADRITVADVGNTNYEIPDEAYIVTGAMEILPLTVEVQTVLTSRTNSILITNDAASNMPAEATPQIIVQLSKDRVEMDASEYINGTAIAGTAGGLLVATDLTPGATSLSIKPLTKQEKHGSITYNMPTRIPTGTIAQIRIWDPAGKNCVEWSHGGVISATDFYTDTASAYQYAEDPSVSFYLSDRVTPAEYATPDAETGRRFVLPDASMYVEQDSDAAALNELVKIVYESVSADTGATTTETFYTQNDFLRRALQSGTYNGVHHVQSITMSYVDEDIANESVKVNLVVNDGVSKLSQDNLTLKNRDRTARITLPTPGNIDRLTIGGKSYTPIRKSSTVYEVELSWLDNPAKLPEADLPVVITYTDTFLNQTSTSELTVQRGGPAADIVTYISESSYTSIISLDPTTGIYTLGVGKTNGKYPSLILNGQATHYEKLRVRVGGYYETLKVPGTGAYNNEFTTKGNWNISIDINDLVKDGYLIEGTSYPVVVSYNDVTGKGSTLNIVLTGGSNDNGNNNNNNSGGSSGSSSGGTSSATDEELEELYDELDEQDEYALSVFAYPQYIRGGYLIGVTQPYNLIYAVGDATTQGTADDIGFFCLKVPSESGTFFTVMVADEEENVGFTTFTSGFGSDTTVPAYPLGIMLLAEDEEDEPVAYPATPLTTDILAPGETIEMSLLLGNALKVGTITISRTINDEITVNARLNDALSAYSLDDVYLTIFDGSPDPLAMDSHSGTSYQLGEPIPVGGIEPWMMLEINLPVEVVEKNGGIVDFTNPSDADAVLYRKLAYYY